MAIPFLDLKSTHQELEEELIAVFRDCLEKSSFIGGHQVKEFEKKFAQFCGTKYAIGVSSGTDALRFALLAAGIGPGDEVITVPNTFIATAEAVSFSGATPAFVDIDDHTSTMDPNKLEDYLKKRLAPSSSPLVPSSSNLVPSSSNLVPSPSSLAPSPSNLVPRSSRPRAVIPVHLFGQTADMDPIMEIARAHGLFVVEDACQAHGAEYKGKMAGSIGDVGCFSFYTGKNIGAYREAGAVVTNDKALAEKVRMMRDHGQPKKYYHDVIGWNARMDGLQGAALSVKLNYLNKWNELRREKAQMYNDSISGMGGVEIPLQAGYAKHVYHLYVIRTQNRDEIISALAGKNIFCGIHYPVPIHLQPAYLHLGIPQNTFPVAEQCGKKFVSLPIFPELTHEQLNCVVNEIKQFVSNRK